MTSQESTTPGKRWPHPGDSLINKFRQGEVVAEVLSVDRKRSTVSVRVKGQIYNSLSSAAKSVSGHPSNGWVYWGLKKQVAYKAKD